MTPLGWVALVVFAVGWIAAVRPIAREIHADFDDTPREAAAVAIFLCWLWPLFAAFWLVYQLARVFEWDTTRGGGDG